MHRLQVASPRPRLALLLAAVLAVACGAGSLSPVEPKPEPASTGPSAQPTASSLPVLPHPNLTRVHSGELSIADIAERVTPSVVSISSTKVSSGMKRPRVPFWPFFGPGAPPPQHREQGLGSGVVIQSGIVVTNNHVVEDADEIQVTTQDGREFNAEVVGTDPKSDLAVVRLQGETRGLVPVEMGDSSRLRLGDVVLAIGNPFGVGQTVTMGIVSAKGRADVGIIDYEDFIQTDAAINPGNSGGALVDMEGHLVGINTAILSRSGGYQGIGFAIPTNMARPIVESLLKHGKVVRGWLGVSIQDIDQDLAKAMRLESTSGVLISDVDADSPAAAAGLKRGDVVLRVNDQPVDSTGRLRNLIAAYGAAARVELLILRDGKERVIKVELGRLPAGESTGEESHPAAPGRGPTSLDGITLEELTPATRKRHQLPAQVRQGVLITGVRRGSSAARAGLRPGDVLLEVDRRKVTSIASFKRLWKRAKGKTLLLVFRHGRTFFVVVTR